MTDERDAADLEERLRGYLDRFTDYPRRDAAAAVPNRSPARWRGLGMGAVAVVATVAVLCVAGSATALVITLRRSTPAAVGALSAVSRPGSLFIPISGQGNGSSSSAGSGVPASLSPASQLGPAPLASGPAADGLRSASSASALYPYFNPCSAESTGRVDSGQIEASGLGQIAGSSAADGEELQIQVTASAATDVAAVAAVQGKEAAVSAAVQRSGVGAAGVTAGPVTIGNGYYYYYPGTSPEQPSAEATITVRAGTIEALAAAADAARGAGVAAEYINQGIGVATPSDDAVAQAIANATDAAHSAANATATAAGLRLGKVGGITTLPPALCYGVDGEQLVVAVIVDYTLS